MIERNIYRVFFCSLEVLLFVEKKKKLLKNRLIVLIQFSCCRLRPLSPSFPHALNLAFHGAVVFCQDERYQGYYAKQLCATVY